MNNLVLAGFMGTGKTAVGRVSARLLNREFVDTDELIVERAGMSIAEIFAQRGEEPFREREREVCAQLSARSGLVIATGGRALVDPENRAMFEDATIVCLQASVDEIVRRLESMHDRPLLAGIRRERVEQLLAARREAYATLPIHIETTGRTIDEVAHQVIEWMGTRELRVQTSDGFYPVWLGHGLLDRFGEVLPRDGVTRCALVTNPSVNKIYGPRVVASLQSAGFEPTVVEIPDGEPFKTLDTVRAVYDQFVAARLERRSFVLALGGGVAGDLAGFAAATFMRGVPFIQIPTTLLAMVDASIGGKVAVDHPAGKNLIGAFKFPRAVMADVDVLATLPIEEYRAGLAEVIKHAIVGDPRLFEELKRAEMNLDLLARAMQVKIALVECDPLENSLRMHLNLGHTFGHALETLSGYRMRHGYAVAIGIGVAARLATRIGWCDSRTCEEIIALLEKNSLPTRLPNDFTAAQILAAMGADKKIHEGKLRLILPRAIGRVEIADGDCVAREEIIAALEESREDL